MGQKFRLKLSLKQSLRLKAAFQQNGIITGICWFPIYLEKIVPVT